MADKHPNQTHDDLIYTLLKVTEGNETPIKYPSTIPMMVVTMSRTLS